MAYNQSNGICPKSVVRPVQASLGKKKEKEESALAVSEKVSGKELAKLIRQLETDMTDAVRKLEFEKAALLRDQITFLRGNGESPSQSISKASLKSKGRYGRKKKYGKRG